jgi:peptidoglycan L-alanyl-D-glutamate endopeptidase CwlK
MAPFSARSLANLQGVHPTLIRELVAFTEVFDCTILGGVRSIQEQAKDVASGLSQTMHSLHLQQPDGYGHAVDVVPTPVNFGDRTPSGLSQWDVQELAFLFAFKYWCKARGVDVRIGADWNGDNLWNGPHRFNDLDHVELPLAES